MKRSFLIFLASIIFIASGCGYTTRSLLAPDLKTVYVSNFKNDINIPAEQSNTRMYRGYTPGMERDITKAVIDKFISDGNLNIAAESNADLIIKGNLTDFNREPLRYDANDNIEEYRIKLIVSLELKNCKTGKIMWTEKGFAGETTYRTSGSLAKSESAAIRDAITDLARRIVERTVEAW